MAEVFSIEFIYTQAGMDATTLGPVYHMLDGPSIED